MTANPTAQTAVPRPRYTITVSKAGVSYKICKVWFGSDGSYYVTPPYHPDRSAFLMKMRVNYARGEQHIAFEDAVERAGLEDDDRSLKLSHHPDGFVQYSGSGILSGKDEDGVARGMGTMSWPLDRPVLGPAFGMTVRGFEKFLQAREDDSDTVVFSWEQMFPTGNANSVNIEGFYFLKRWRRFIRTGSDGVPRIRIVHPSKAVVELRVLLPVDTCPLGGFIGVEAYATWGKTPQESEGPFFSMGGPTGDLAENLDGELTAVSLNCLYPKGELHVDRTLEYRMMDLSDHPGGRGAR